VALGAQGHTLPEKKRLVLRSVRIVTINAATVCGSFVRHRF
jgi:hypothetical protein